MRFKTIQIGDKINIEGEIEFNQDRKKCKGSFDGIIFTLDDIGESRIRLTTPGYGGEPYGNGAIYVHKSQFNQVWAMREEAA